MISPRRPLAETTFDIDPHIGRKLDDVEKDLILGTLTRCGGNRTWAADILGISLHTLRNKLQRHGADRSRDPFLKVSSTSTTDEDAMLAQLQSFDPGTRFPS